MTTILSGTNAGRHLRFNRPRPVHDYGYDGDGSLIEQPGSPSGYLLPWEAIDDYARSVVEHRPPMYLVVGEWVRSDGIRLPELAVAADFMEWQGFVRDGRRWAR